MYCGKINYISYCFVFSDLGSLVANKVQDVLEVFFFVSEAFISVSCLVRSGLMWQSFFLLRHKSDLLLYLTGIVKPSLLSWRSLSSS